MESEQEVLDLTEKEEPKARNSDAILSMDLEMDLSKFKIDF